MCVCVCNFAPVPACVCAQLSWVNNQGVLIRSNQCLRRESKLQGAQHLKACEDRAAPWCGQVQMESLAVCVVSKRTCVFVCVHFLICVFVFYCTFYLLLKCFNPLSYQEPRCF